MVVPPGWEDISSLTQEQIRILIKIERAGAGLSMVAIAFTITTFALFKRFRTTPNLFLICALVANIGACIASMIGYSGIHDGENSSLCQAQAFFFEWFMQSDPWWSFAMSLNVFLVFFGNVNPAKFRKYAWVYCLICYGGPLIPAITLISIRGDPRGPIFGNAALWCFISAEWSLIRIYAFYIPIWVCVLLSLLIYIAVGYHVFHHRNQLKHVTSTLNSSGQREKRWRISRKHNSNDSAEERLTHQPGIYCTAVTEVHVSSIRRTSQELLGFPAPVHSRYPPGVSDSDWDYAPARPQFETICTSNNPPLPPKKLSQRIRDALGAAAAWVKDVACATLKRLKRLDPIKMAYLRTSFIFGLAVLVTWTPSSVNRVYSLWHNGRISFELSVASGCVLPLQGVWNSIIFFTTSWRAVREEWAAFKARRQTRQIPTPMPGLFDGAAGGRFGPGARVRRDSFSQWDSPRARGSGMPRHADEYELQERPSW